MKDFSPLDPHIRLFGDINADMFNRFTDQFNEARKAVPAQQPVVLELTTTGGEAETARRIACDLRLFQLGGRQVRFLGKSAVYSAGITIMSAFKPEHRALTAKTELLIHERRTDKTLELKGALRANMALLRDVLAEMESGTRLERDGFTDLVAGSKLTLDDLMKKVLHADLYMSAEEALEQGLVHAVI